MTTPIKWFADIWRGRNPRETLNEYVIQLDEPADLSREKGRGSCGAVFDVKYHGATCIGKRVLDILVGLGGYDVVGKEQYNPLVEKFRSECDMLRRLRHPNVVQFMGIYLPTEDIRELTLVMEKLHMDAQHFIDNNKKVSLSIKLQILKDTSSGLLHIHSHNIIHRDLNAGNILLTENLRAKVADFGMSRVVDKSQLAQKRGQMTKHPGAPDYMPPEALTGEYDEKLDSFSLGHFMLYLINEDYPQPEDPVSILKDTCIERIEEVRKSIEIERRKKWITAMGKDHILYNMVTSCLQDQQKDRVSMTEIDRNLMLACQKLPNDQISMKNESDALCEQYKRTLSDVIDKLSSLPGLDLRNTGAQSGSSNELHQQLIDKVGTMHKKERWDEIATIKQHHEREKENKNSEIAAIKQQHEKEKLEMKESLESKDDEIAAIKQQKLEKETLLRNKDDTIDALIQQLESEKLAKGSLLKSKDDEIAAMKQQHEREILEKECLLKSKDDEIAAMKQQHEREKLEKESSLSNKDEIAAIKQQHEREKLEKESFLKSKDDEIAAMKQQLETEKLSKESSLKSKDDEIAVLKQQIERDKLAKRTLLKCKDDEIAAMKQQLETEKLAKESSLKSKDDEIAVLKQQVEREKLAKRTSLKSKDDEIAAIKQQHEKEILGNKRSLTSKNDEIAAIKEQYKREQLEKEHLSRSKDDEIAAIKQQHVSEKDTINKKLIGKDSKIRQLSSEKNEIQIECDHLKAKLDSKERQFLIEKDELQKECDYLQDKLNRKQKQETDENAIKFEEEKEKQILQQEQDKKDQAHSVTCTATQADEPKDTSATKKHFASNLQPNNLSLKPESENLSQPAKQSSALPRSHKVTHPVAGYTRPSLHKPGHHDGSTNNANGNLSNKTEIDDKTKQHKPALYPRPHAGIGAKNFTTMKHDPGLDQLLKRQREKSGQ